MDLDTLLSSGKLGLDIVTGGVALAEKIGQIVERGDKGGIPAAEVAKLTLELQNQLIDARKAQIDLLSAIGDLKGEMIEIDRRLELQARYEPVTTAGGAFVLVLKSSEERREPPHYICPDCADEGRRSFLQPQGTGKRCNHHDRFFPFEPATNGPQIARRQWDVTDPYNDL